MTLETIRDISIIVVALLNIVFLLALLLIVVMLYQKIGPLLESAKGALNNIQGTTAFLAETTVHPVIRVISTVTAVRTTLGSILKGKRRKVG